MLFYYKATTPNGEIKEGELEASSQEIALSSLQRRGLIVISLVSKSSRIPFFDKDIFSFKKVKRKDIVMLSRQIATLFEAKVSVLSAFKLLSAEIENPAMREVLNGIVVDISGGSRIAEALSRYPKVFSNFYVSMVKTGEESGKLDEIFKHLADYLERNAELIGKAKKALIYPAFVVAAFIGVIVVMMVVVIPKLTDIIKESGQEAPLYTKAVMYTSDILRNYGAFFFLFLAVGVFLLWRYSKTPDGRLKVASLQLSIPYLGTLYQKLYLARIADNLETLITGGVSMIRSLEITSDVVESPIYRAILKDTIESVKGGATISESFSRYHEISPLMGQMIKIGEETGKLDFIFKTLAGFYKREMDDALETMIGLIEPAMTVVLGVGVGLLLASVLVPIYNIAMAV
ncbi:MAG: type II secretion system F family protein [Candidatus Pacebacteria bacterium]|nr:type II secretion system F family protein [Candidatus Paceibacterota bacterium]